MRALYLWCLKRFQEKSCASARKRPLSHFGSSCPHPKMHPAAWGNNQTLWILKLLRTQTEPEKQSRKLSSLQCSRKQGSPFPSDLEGARTEGNEPTGLTFSLISSTAHYFVNGVSNQNWHRTCNLVHSAHIHIVSKEKNKCTKKCQKITLYSKANTSLSIFLIPQKTYPQLICKKLKHMWPSTGGI